MTEPLDLRASLERLERKVDKIDSKVDQGDRGSQQLIELLKQQLHYLQQSIDELKQLVGAERVHTDRATSAVRVDVERQLAEQKAQCLRESGDINKRLDDARDERSRIYLRIESNDKAVNRLYGGLALAATLGFSGLAALIRGLG